MKRITKQYEFADACGMSESQFSLVLADKSNTSLERARKIAARLKTGVAMWQESGHAQERLDAYKRYKERICK
jgi:transcriptional regulator with XRE-family HTH domain